MSTLGSSFLESLRKMLGSKVSDDEFKDLLKKATDESKAAEKGGKDDKASSGAGASQPKITLTIAGENDVHSVASVDGDSQLFIELPRDKRFAEGDDLPTSIPYLPVPGTYHHSKWGKIVLTQERNADFVEKFRSGVYQKHLPIDAEHQLTLSGAVGYINGLSQNSDGSVDADVEWTDRGKSFLTQKRFRYFSPSFFDKWPDPVQDGVVHTNVACGGALTTRPFFKEANLRPIIAHEGGDIDIAELPEEDEVTILAERLQPDPEKGETVKPENNGDTVVISASEHTELMSFKEAMTAKDAEIASLKTLAETQGQAISKATEAIETMTANDRKREFTDMVLGRGGDRDGRRWFGEVETHVNMLELLVTATEQGKESEQFKAYVTQQDALAEQLSKAQLFNEVGSSKPGAAGGNSAEARLEAQVKEIQAAEKDVTREDAIVRVLSENPDLYDEYEREKKGAR